MSKKNMSWLERFINDIQIEGEHGLGYTLMISAFLIVVMIVVGLIGSIIDNF